MSVIFQVTHEMDQQAWEDHVLGSGAFSWSWWDFVDVLSDGLNVGWYRNVDYSTVIDTKFLTWQEIADKCSELAKDHSVVAEQLLNDDFDAVYMDCVLQFAFIGEIRYG